MTEYSIFEHSASLPYKQTFRAILPNRISQPNLIVLTRHIADAHRKGTKRIFINWWLASQDRSTEMCWAHSKVIDGNIHVGTNLLSLEEHLEAVETRPLREDSELGLWHWDLGSISHYIQLIPAGPGKVEVRKSFLDGSSRNEVMTVVSESPLRLQGEGGRYLELEEDGLTHGDDDGFVIVSRVR